MENASKALIIAGAILLSILIISLGIGIYNMAIDSIGKVNMNEMEIQQFNSKFADYEGTRVRGSNVRTLAETVLNHNITNQEDESLCVTVTVGGTTIISPTDLELTPTEKNSIASGSTYSVTMTKNSSGLITTIAIVVNP